ncbi:MAG: FHA domain-containing protein [Pseudomonadota bacterium]
MELIVEVFADGSRNVERFRIDKDRFTIGRAYNCEVFISDRTVSPTHAEVVIDAGVIRLNDLDSLNGVHRLGATDRQKSFEVVAGNSFIIGRTRVRILSVDAPVPEAVPLHDALNQIPFLSKWYQKLAVVGLFALLLAFEQWRTAFEKMDWSSFFAALFILCGFIFVLTLLWGFIGRVIVHETRFADHFVAMVAYLFVQSVLVLGREWFEFNLQDFWWSWLPFAVISTALLAMLLVNQLYLATHMNFTKRSLIGMTLALLVVVSLSYRDIDDRMNFSSNPFYVTVILPPAYRLAPHSEINEFVEDAQSIFTPPAD